MDVKYILLGFILTLIISLVLTPFIIKIAFKFNIVDRPDERKLHKGTRPYLGGVVIFISFISVFLILGINIEHQMAIMTGAVIMLLTGLFDDIVNLKPIYKLLGQLSSASVLVYSGVVIEKITIPFLGTVQLGSLSIAISIIWIIVVSNAINLIDGLDGLATGVSTIALISILTIGILDYRVSVVYLCILLIGSNLGFLFWNFYPSKIFLGDAGSLFIGYMIAVISMLGLFKNVAIFSFIIPLIILAFPIIDTLFAIIRRLKNGQNILAADRKHIHYKLLEAGFSHRGAVLLIYGISSLFGVLAIFYGNSTLTTSILIIIVILLLVHLIAEFAGLVGDGQQPILNFLRKLLKEVKRKNHI